MRYLLFFMAVFLAALAISAIARAEDSSITKLAPSPSLSPSPSSSPEPVADTAVVVPRAPQWVVDWARKWQGNAQSVRPKLVKARWCFGLDAPKRVPGDPLRSATYDVWHAYGQKMKALTYYWMDRFREFRHRMIYPGGSGAERWRPLVRWHWPSELVSTAIYVIRLESGGWPSIRNGSSGAAGLFQLYPAPSGWANPDYNVWYAYHCKYLHGGWGHWVVMR